MMTTAVRTIPRYNCEKTRRQSQDKQKGYRAGFRHATIQRWRLCLVCVRAHVCFSHIIARRVVLCGCLDGVSQEAEDGTDPQQDREATEQLAAKLNPLGGRGGRGEGIGSISKQKLCCPGVGQALATIKETIFI